ncbi:COPI associated protein (macronuclear) [Tetrahymena thermophila SB210]|uniref:COPI associated protein n=1 Tax=Tetrahymena thermophila (strain SB210) TaxID=312017 RepID=W7XGX2_TETTS|nr:COPI associated protein [Tetrahymena thermophila SB210]EWS72249.1 COPI associated protein [Tetrahymena thermophila SB210]|eukprot:XP_012655189.1 COPI associated protein [Tetrahymena thermophila SB210]
MSATTGKVIKIINICSALVLAIAGVWRIVSLQIFKILDTWQCFDFFMPFFMILLGVMLLVIEFKRDFMEKYFFFLTTLLGRGIFNVFLSSMSVFSINNEFNSLLAPFIYSLILFVIGFFYIILSLFLKDGHEELKEQLV